MYGFRAAAAAAVLNSFLLRVCLCGWQAEKAIMKAIPDKAARKRMERNINEREAFEMFDQDGSGQIDAQEFKKVVEELGVALGPDDRALAFRTLDKDGSGAVDFEEFAAW